MLQRARPELVGGIQSMATSLDGEFLLANVSANHIGLWLPPV
jgi:hypothetical protein